MDIDSEINEINAKKRILDYFKLFGLNQEVRHILSPESKNPTVTFKAKTKEEYLKIMQTLKPEALNIYLEKRGTTGFNPILKTQVIKEDEHITTCSSPYILGTETDNYNSDQEIKIRFNIPYKNGYISVWIEAPISLFPQTSYIKETIKNEYETQQARQYNHKHAEITTTRPIFSGIIQTVKYYGGYVSHYTTTEAEKIYFHKLLFLEL